MEHSQTSYSFQKQTVGQNQERTFQPSVYLDDYRSGTWNGYNAMSVSATRNRIGYNRWKNFPMQLPPFNSSQNVRLPAAGSQNNNQTIRMPTPPSYNRRQDFVSQPMNVNPSFTRMPSQLTNPRESDRPPFSNIQRNNTVPDTEHTNFWRQNTTGSSAGEASLYFGHASYQSMNFNPMSLYGGFQTNTSSPYHCNSNVSPQFGNKQQYPPNSSHINKHNSVSVNALSQSVDQSVDCTDDRSILGKWYKLPDSDIQGATGIEKHQEKLEEVMKQIENSLNKEKSVTSTPEVSTNSPIHDVSVSLEMQEVNREGDQNRQDIHPLPVETENHDASCVTERNPREYVVEKIKNKRKRRGSQKVVTPITIKMVKSGRNTANPCPKSLSYGLPVPALANDAENHGKQGDQPYRKTQIVKPMIGKSRKNSPALRSLESILTKMQKRDVTSSYISNKLGTVPSSTVESTKSTVNEQVTESNRIHQSSMPLYSESTGSVVSVSVECESTGSEVLMPMDTESTGSVVSVPLDSESTGSVVSMILDSESAGGVAKIPLDCESTGSVVSMPLDSESTGSVVRVPLNNTSTISVASASVDNSVTHGIGQTGLRQLTNKSDTDITVSMEYDNREIFSDKGGNQQNNSDTSVERGVNQQTESRNDGLLNHVGTNFVYVTNISTDDSGTKQNTVRNIGGDNSGIKGCQTEEGNVEDRMMSKNRDCHSLDSVGSNKDALENVSDKGKERTVSLKTINDDSRMMDNMELDVNIHVAKNVNADQTERRNKTSFVDEQKISIPDIVQNGDQSIDRTNLYEGNKEKQKHVDRTKGNKALVVKLFDVRKCKNMKKMLKKFNIKNLLTDTEVDVSKGKINDAVKIDSDEEDFSFPAFDCTSKETDCVSVSDVPNKIPDNSTIEINEKEKIHGKGSVESSMSDSPVVDCDNINEDSDICNVEEDNTRQVKLTNKHDESEMSDVLPNLQYKKGLVRKRHKSNIEIDRDCKKRPKEHRTNIEIGKDDEKIQKSGCENRSTEKDQEASGKNKEVYCLSDHNSITQAKVVVDDSGNGKGSNKESPNKNIEESTDLVEILSHVEQYFKLEFHGSSVLCVSINTCKYLVMKELLTKCFKSIMNPKKGSLSSKFRQVYLAKERDLKIPYKELPDNNKLVVGKYLVSLEIAGRENPQHIGIISLSDALRLYHYFFGVKSCIDCLKLKKSQSLVVSLPETVVPQSDTCEDDNGAESDTTIQYEDSSDDTDDETVQAGLPSETEDRVMKGGIAELYMKMFRFIVINCCKYFPLKDLELFWQVKTLEQIISTREIKTRDCTEIEGSFFCKLEPSMPVILAGDRLVEEKVLHEAAKCFVNQSEEVNESHSQECLSQADIEKIEIDKGIDEGNLNKQQEIFIDLTINNTEQSLVNESDMEILQVCQSSCNSFDKVFKDIGQPRNIGSDICPKEDDYGKMFRGDAEDIVSILNDALSQDNELKSFDYLDKTNQFEEVEPEELKKMFCVCQKSFSENQKSITHSFLALWKQNISLKKQVDNLTSEIEDFNKRHDMLETKRKKYEDMLEQLTSV